jgi:hypothetical protein
MAKPTHRIMQIEDRGKDKKSFWREVGVAFTNVDGSQNLVFSVIPRLDLHTVQLRKIEEKQEQDGGSKPEAPNGGQGGRGKGRRNGGKNGPQHQPGGAPAPAAKGDAFEDDTEIPF